MTSPQTPDCNPGTILMINKEMPEAVVLAAGRQSFLVMKFPKPLSRERLYLLSPEDRKTYESEHPSDGRAPGGYEPIFEDVDAAFESMESAPVRFVLDEEALMVQEMETVYRELFSDIMDEREFMRTSVSLNSEFTAESPRLDESAPALNEGAEGLDCMAWLRGLNLGWLGKLAGAGLAALGTGIAALIVAGKDRIAMWRLKKYMNRLVEVIDQGIQKKRPLLTAIMPKSWAKWHGEKNLTCFRSYQEMADRTMANGVMSAAHKLGYFAQGQMMNISSGATPQPGGGLDDFRKNVLSQISVIVPQKPPKNQFAEEND